MEWNDLWRRPAGRMAAEGVVVSSRVRLARNLEGEVFPDRADERDRVRVWEFLRALLASRPGLEPALAADMSALDDGNKLALLERHLLSREQAGKSRGSGLVLAADESASVMVNEEDHLRLQALEPGLRLDVAWERAHALDNAIEAEAAYAFSSRFGYLTACPTNVGTGLRASVMLHLPALSLLDEIGPVVKGLGKIGLAVRGLWGEGTEALGHLFQVSNQVTLGETEGQIIAHLRHVVEELVRHEENARLRLVEKHPAKLQDLVGRARGILSHARILSSKEALILLSGLRLGLETGMVKGLTSELLRLLFFQVQPGHLQQRAGRTLDTDERDRARADLVRQTIDGSPMEMNAL